MNHFIVAYDADVLPKDHTTQMYKKISKQEFETLMQDWVKEVIMDGVQYSIIDKKVFMQDTLVYKSLILIMDVEKNNI